MEFDTSTLDSVAILDRITSVYGFSQKVQLANHFGVAASSLSNRYTRGNISYDYAAICSLETGANLLWILTGQGERFTGEGVQAVNVQKTTTLSRFTISESQLSNIGSFVIDNSFLSSQSTDVFCVESEASLYFVESSTTVSDGLKLIDIDGAISFRELSVLPGKKLHVTGGKVPFECTFDDIKVLGRVTGIYNEVN